jgi:DNA invertase Pin-like site-specific DNA recombinase
MINSGKANAIIAYDPSRLARNAHDAAQILEMLDSGKLKDLIFANFMFQNNSYGKFMLGFAFAQSKLYTDSLSEVVLRGMASSANKGKYPGKAKTGYLNHPKTHDIFPDPDRFHLVKKVYEIYATDRYSLSAMVDEIEKIGLTNHTGNPIRKSQVTNLLTDPFYYGAFIWSKELYKGNHKPAVSKNLWDKVQAMYKKRSRPISKWREEKVFTGLFRCGECGASITAERHTKTMKSSKTHSWLYYRCTKKKKSPCSQPYLREELLLEQLQESVMSIALPDEMVIPMLNQIEEWEIEEASRVSEQSIDLKREAKEVGAKLRRLNELYVDGELNREEHTSRKKVLVNEEISLEKRIKAIASKGGKFWLEPMKEFVNSLWERNLREAVGDPLKLRDIVVEGGSNHLIESQKVLWNWNSPYEILASRGVCSSWLTVVSALRTHFESNMEAD